MNLINVDGICSVRFIRTFSATNLGFQTFKEIHGLPVAEKMYSIQSLQNSEPFKECVPYQIRRPQINPSFTNIWT